MPFGLGGGPWWRYGQGGRYGWPSRCARYPWLPRWWWAAENCLPTQPTKKEEMNVLEEEAKSLREDLKAIDARIKQLKEEKD